MRKSLKNHDEVAHYWANQIQAEGHAGNMLFNDKTIYSYGRHFAIARHHKIKSEAVVLFTTRRRSLSTGAHKSLILSACSHLNVLHVDNVTADNRKEHLANVKDRMDTIDSLLCKAKRARANLDRLNQQALRAADELKQYAALFLPRHKFEFDNLDAIQAARATIEKRENARRKRQVAGWAKANKAAVKGWQGKVLQWKAHEIDRVPNHPERHTLSPPIFLRVKGDNVQTSTGAEVPRHDAKLFFALCKKCKDAGHAMNKFTRKVGVYSPSNIDEQGNATVDCHVLPFSEMERIAGQL